MQWHLNNAVHKTQQLRKDPIEVQTDAPTDCDGTLEVLVVGFGRFVRIADETWIDGVANDIVEDDLLYTDPAIKATAFRISELLATPRWCRHFTDSNLFN